MSARRLLFLLVLVASLAVPASAVAGGVSQSGSGGILALTSDASWAWKPGAHRFATVVLGAAHWRLRLTPGAVRKHSGRRLEWKCTSVPGPVDAFGTDRSWERIERGQSAIHIDPQADYCLLQVVHSTVRRHNGIVDRTSAHYHQALALSPAGGAYIARMGGVARLWLERFLPQVMANHRTGVLPTAASIVAKAKDPRLVALASPAARPPARKVGLWTDAAHHWRLCTLLPDGTLVYYDRDEATKALSTNVQDEWAELSRSSTWWLEYRSSSTTSDAGDWTGYAPAR